MKNLFLLGIVLFSNFIFSQSDKNNANIWYFGQYAGIDFNSGTATGITDGQLFTYEGCATVCNQNGELLFYTDGSTVWNKNHDIMPNGTGLLGNPSASQSSIIVPVYQDTNLYYIFTVDARENDLLNGLRYSIVNMTWDGGLGDVTYTKNVLLHAPVSEKLTAVFSNNMIDVWIITHEWNSDAFYAYKLTFSGVQPPVISNVGMVHTGGSPSNAGAIGQIKVSPNQDKMIVGIRGNDTYEYFDFNNVTGEISNPITLTGYLWAYTGEFSEDGNKLYVIDKTTMEIHQFDAYTSDLTELMNSKVVVDTILADYVGAMQMGPDGNIYISKRYHEYLARIENPSSSYPTYVDEAVYLEGRTSEWGLPNIFYYKGWETSLKEKPTSYQKSPTPLVYPNPAKEIITFNIDNNSNKQATIKIINSNGQTIKLKSVYIDAGQFSISTEDLINGLYQFVITDENNVYFGKFEVIKD